MSTVQVVDSAGNQTVQVVTGGTVVTGGGGGGVAGGLTVTPKVKTGPATYAIQLTDTLIFANATSGSFSMSLPSAVGFTSWLIIVATGTNANIVSLTTQVSGQTISGAASIQLGNTASGVPYRTAMLMSDGSNWWVI